MDKLHSLFHENIQTLYSAKEMSEILIMIYNDIELAVKLNTSKLKVLPTHIFHLGEDETIILDSQFFENQLISNLDILDLIVSRDDVVRNHLELIFRGEDELVYKLTEPDDLFIKDR